MLGCMGGGLSSVFARMFGESVVSFPHAKRYNWLCITEATSFGKDKGSVNRRGTEPFVFIGAFLFYIPCLAAGLPWLAVFLCRSLREPVGNHLDRRGVRFIECCRVRL